MTLLCGARTHGAELHWQGQHNSCLQLLQSEETETPALGFVCLAHLLVPLAFSQASLRVCSQWGENGWNACTLVQRRWEAERYLCQALSSALWLFPSAA